MQGLYCEYLLAGNILRLFACRALVLRMDHDVCSGCVLGSAVAANDMLRVVLHSFVFWSLDEAAVMLCCKIGWCLTFPYGGDWFD